jgi:hypothetical protein
MRCLYCKQVIGPLRRLRDSEFCSTEHRRKMRGVSARAAREFDETDSTYEPFWPVMRPEAPVHKHTQSSASSTVVFGVLLVTALIIGSSGIGSNGPGPVSSRPSAPETPMWKNFLQREGAVKYREDFGGGLGQWRGSTSSDGWTNVNGLLRPGKLRLWSPTEKMADYNFEFVGQIEQKGMGWAYRAQDLKNFYATKIVITKPGPLPRAELVRYSVVDGLSSARTKLPLPIMVRTDTVYHVRMNVRSDQFSTLVNGQMVDTWSDQRFKTGGVGFFSEAGEVALVRWASVASRDNVLGHLMSYFGMLLPVPVPVP